MEELLPPLNVQVTKTSDGKLDYMQITSSDQFAINIVLISKGITVEDCREQPKPQTEPQTEPQPKSQTKRKRKREIQS